MAGSSVRHAVQITSVCTILLCAAGAIAQADLKCWVMVQQNCCSVIVGPSTRPPCNGIPCDDLIILNEVVDRVNLTTNGALTARSLIEKKKCQWQARACNENGQCVNVGNQVFLECTMQDTVGSACKSHN
jgi:hypothetical protein